MLPLCSPLYPSLACLTLNLNCLYTSLLEVSWLKHVGFWIQAPCVHNLVLIVTIGKLLDLSVPWVSHL